jgi:hypothetical protein
MVRGGHAGCKAAFLAMGRPKVSSEVFGGSGLVVDTMVGVSTKKAGFLPVVSHNVSQYSCSRRRWSADKLVPWGVVLLGGILPCSFL